MADDARTMLRRLARAHGVQWRYTGQDGSEQTVPDEALVAVLRALGVDVRPDGVAALTEALDDAELGPWRDVLPPTVATRVGHRLSVPAHVSTVEGLRARVVTEDGSVVPLAVPTPLAEARRVDGVERVRCHVEIPADLPPGWHRLELDAAPGDHAEAVLICAPERLTTADPFLARRGWGVAAQGYSVTSAGSWGIGDVADAAAVGEIGAAHGADFLLLHPLHAIEPAGAPSDSPYSPVTRRFLSALLIRVTDIPEFALLPAREQERLRAAGRAVQERLDATGRIDRAAVADVLWPALARVHAVPRSPAREAAYAAFRAEQGEGLEAFAAWSVRRRVELMGAEAADEAAELDLHRWVQWVADEQLGGAQARVRAAGMRLGLMLDLAVGATRNSADAAMLGDVLASSMSVGAPPEVFNQRGQDWSQHPWHPRRLAETGYAAFRDMLRTVMRHAGGLRMDHVLGLFRLWWIPEGADATRGAYVEYDHEAMLAVLTLEAQRAGVVVIGEDLGTFEPWVQRRLAEAGILGTSILWFEQADGLPTPPEEYRRLCLAAVTTHDLPPTAGYLEGVHLDLRERLGLFTGDVAAERHRSAAEVDAFLGACVDRGLLDPADAGGGADRAAQVLALYRLLAQAPSALHTVSLVDAVGERRIQNQPGTLQSQYPNWTVPLGDAAGSTLHVEDLASRADVAALFDAVDHELRAGAPIGIAVALHTSPLDQPGRGDAGGMNVYVRQSALALARRGVRMVLLTRAQEPVGPDGVRVTVLPAGGDAPEVVVAELAAGPAGPVRKEDLAAHTEAFTAAARAWLASGTVPGGPVVPERVAFVHGHYWLSAPTAHALAAATGAPHLQTMHTAAAVKMRQDADLAEPARRLAAEERIVAEADLLVVNSPAEAAELQDVLGADRRRLRIVTPGVDLGVFTPDGPVLWPGRAEDTAAGTAQDPARGTGPLRVLFAGRIQRHKGPQLLVEALGELARRRGAEPGVLLHVNGEQSGNEELDLAALAAEHGVAGLVTFSAPVLPEALAAQYRAADVVAMPSRSETFGLVALEAQACATPVLAHRVGGLVHAVQDGITGWLVSPATPTAWADAFEAILDDRAAWAALGPAAVRHARGHSWARYADELLEAAQGLRRRV